VFFTSVAGRLGNRGQGDYGAANETVSKLARQLAAEWPSTRVVAISWGPWDAGGMVSPEVRAQFDRLGIEPIDPRLGEQAFWLEVTRGANEEPEVVWGRGPWENDAARLVALDGAQPPRAAAE
jgi:NAD(P)-dependent dehydrogenase (short-subunit alcohol dehydrogenase family)